MNDQNNSIKELIKQSKEQLQKDLEQMKQQSMDETSFDFKELELNLSNDLDLFEEQAWHKGDGYTLPSYPMLTDLLEGLDEGLYLVAGESNTGKSALMMNWIYDACTHRDNKLFGIYYCLDDTKNDIIPRIIAMDQEIPIGVCAKPQRYQNKIDNQEDGCLAYEQMLLKRKEGLEKLRSYSDRLRFEDGNRISTAEKMFAHMKAMQSFVKTIEPDMDIIVGIDAVDDIRFGSKKGLTTTDRHAEIARTIKDWATELHIPVFGTRHLSKLRQNRRPTLDDLKDSNEYVYEASVVFLVYNDVSKNKEAAQIFTTIKGVENKVPVLEIDWAKNKKSSYKGRTYCQFQPEYSKTKEFPKELAKQFDQIIYSTL